MSLELQAIGLGPQQCGEAWCSRPLPTVATHRCAGHEHRTQAHALNEKELGACPLSCVVRRANMEVPMSRSTPAIILAGAICSFPILALAQQSPETDLARFRSEYISGEGLAYVVINDAKGEHLYRFGDASRLTAKKDTRGYMLFTCAAPHVFLPQKPEDKAALEKAQVVKPGNPRFAELDGKYLAGCKNPFVKSAIPKGAS
jgi:hypothetical protein